MKDGQLGRMGLKELHDLRSRVTAAIAAREHQEKIVLKNRLTEMAGKAGFSVQELFGHGRKTLR